MTTLSHPTRHRRMGARHAGRHRARLPLRPSPRRHLRDPAHLAPRLSHTPGAFQASPIGALADFTGASAAMSTQPTRPPAITVDYTLKLLAEARGDELIARAHVLRAGGLTVTSVELHTLTTQASISAPPPSSPHDSSRPSRPQRSFLLTEVQRSRAGRRSIWGSHERGLVRRSSGRCVAYHRRMPDATAIGGRQWRTSLDRQQPSISGIRLGTLVFWLTDRKVVRDMLGDYDSLPRTFDLAEYVDAMSGFDVRGVVWSDAGAADPVAGGRMGRGPEQ